MSICVHIQKNDPVSNWYFVLILGKLSNLRIQLRISKKKIVEKIMWGWEGFKLIWVYVQNNVHIMNILLVANQEGGTVKTVWLKYY